MILALVAMIGPFILLAVGATIYNLAAGGPGGLGPRARRLIEADPLAMESFRVERGNLPERLDELVGTYLDKMPIDPHSGEQFHYFPDGLPIPLTAPRSDVAYRPNLDVLVLPNQPFIWSAGTGVDVRQGGSKFRTRCKLAARKKGTGTAGSAFCRCITG